MSHLVRLTLRLGRNPDAGFPDGDDATGYVIVAPVDREGQLDLDLWRTRRSECVARRFTPGHENDADGWLSHSGGRWFIRYDEDHEGPNEDLHRLGEHHLTAGEYVTIHHPGDGALVFRVTEAHELH